MADIRWRAQPNRRAWALVTARQSRAGDEWVTSRSAEVISSIARWTNDFATVGMPVKVIARS